jgi:hypothetical protein
MTTPRTARAIGTDGQAAGGWRASLPELTVAIVFVAAITGAAYAWAGAAAAVLVLAGCAFLALALVRFLPDAQWHHGPPPADWHEQGQTSISGFWRKRGMVSDATTSMASYDHELRATLQHLLAARLAQRHGISLYTDPDAARRLLLTSARDQDLWHWLDPSRPANADQNRAGIPARTLAVIIDRLERL